MRVKGLIPLNLWCLLIARIRFLLIAKLYKIYQKNQFSSQEVKELSSKTANSST